jgi:hypothetical protein
MPDVVWDPLPENRTEPYINPSQIIIHTAVDGNLNIPDYFRRRDVYVESHFWITRDGRITQMMDTHRQADANYRANYSAISVETEDDGDPEGIPWTNAQIGSLVRVIQWASATHGIPIERCRSSTAPGVGWHSMWSYPTDPINLRGRPVASPWTTALGKTCPGRTRIRQLVETVLPRAAGEVVDPGDPDPETRATVREGSRGADVKSLQEHLKLPADGIFGSNTEAAVKTFQMAQGLTIDGIVGPNTWSRVDKSKPVFEQKTSQYLPYTLWLRSPYSYRSQYQALTRVLNAELLLPASPIFSTRTDAAARGFQRGTDLTVDGMVGRKTWGTLFFGRPDD